MAIVIGSNTQVSFGQACVVSVSWSMSQNSQKLFCLGSWDPHMTIDKPTQTVNLTVYSPGPGYDTKPTTSCADANTIPCSVSPEACGGGAGGGVDGSFYVTSYSYSKEAIMPGQESWSLMRYVGENPPSYNLRGITEGQATGESGMTFDTESGSGSSGNVSAGGFGKADEMVTGVVIKVGGGSSAASATGNGSASIPYTPLWV